MVYQYIHYDIDRGVAVITLNRPGKLNAYTPDMGEELVDATRHALAQDSVRALVLTGAGRGFCAGADRACFSPEAAHGGQRLGEEYFLTGFAEELAAADKLLIAAVNGIAAGIGATMTLPFDLRLATEQASFDFPFVRLGIAPGFGCSYFLPRLIGTGSASDVILNSRRLAATTAHRLGLVQQIIPVGQLLPTAIAMARSITAGSNGVDRQCKQLLVASRESTLGDCMRREQQASQVLAERRLAETPGP